MSASSLGEVAVVQECLKCGLQWVLKWPAPVVTHYAIFDPHAHIELIIIPLERAFFYTSGSSAFWQTREKTDKKLKPLLRNNRESNKLCSEEHSDIVTRVYHNTLGNYCPP